MARRITGQALAKAGRLHVGIDLHKEFLQVAAMGPDGDVVCEERVGNDRDMIRSFFSRFPGDARYVVESSSVWYGLYRYMKDELGMDVTVSNPFHNKVIASSKKKTDKVDARVLADLDRGGYISECYVPDRATVDRRRLVRYRSKMVRMRTAFKNGIHGILLQDGIKVPGRRWADEYVSALARLGDYRIGCYLAGIRSLDEIIRGLDAKVRAANAASDDARRLKGIPGVGEYIALALLAEIGDISRFPDPHRLCAYAGIVPSVRSSADTVHHGRITRRGSRMLRWVLVEAVHTHVRVAPGTDLSRFYRRLAKKRGRSKAAVAAASKLLRIVYHVLERGEAYSPHHGQGPKPRQNIEA